MSYNEYEVSVADGAPLSLYRFTRGDKKWLYTNADRDIAFGGDDYLAVAISDSGVQQSGQPVADDFTITMPASSALCQLYRGTGPSDSIFLRVHRKHAQDEEAPVVWVGAIVQVKRKSNAESEVLCQSLIATMRRDGLRLGWERGCPHMLYDNGCKVDKDNFKVEVAEIFDLTGNSFAAPEIDGYADGWFDAGFVEWSLGDGVFERRPIESHMGDTITLLGFSDGLANGMAVNLYPGCQRITQVCQQKFNNLSNYGGFPHMPEKSPFDGDPVF